MRISEKIELGYDDDFFAGCELANELSAVILRGLVHDDGGAAFRIAQRTAGIRPYA